MHGLAGITDKMRPDAQIAQSEQLAHGQRMGGIAALGRSEAKFPGIFPCRHVTPQQGKILYQLLPAVHQVVRQEAGLVFVTAHGSERRIIILPCRRQSRELRTAQDGAVVRYIQKMARIEIGIVRLAGIARDIRLLRQEADLGGRRRRAQEGGNLFGKIPHRQLADSAMAGAAPAQHRRR